MVTFVFGLTAGLLLILFVIPAILMIDADIRRAMGALRKAAWGKAAVARVRGVAVPGVTVLYLVLMGPLFWPGERPTWVQTLMPTEGSAPAALVLFLAATAVLCGTLWALGPTRRRIR